LTKKKGEGEAIGKFGVWGEGIERGVGITTPQKNEGGKTLRRGAVGGELVREKKKRGKRGRAELEKGPKRPVVSKNRWVGEPNAKSGRVGGWASEGEKSWARVGIKPRIHSSQKGGLVSQPKKKKLLW